MSDLRAEVGGYDAGSRPLFSGGLAAGLLRVRLLHVPLLWPGLPECAAELGFMGCRPGARSDETGFRRREDLSTPPDEFEFPFPPLLLESAAQRFGLNPVICKVGQVHPVISIEGVRGASVLQPGCRGNRGTPKVSVQMHKQLIRNDVGLSQRRVNLLALRY